MCEVNKPTYDGRLAVDTMANPEHLAKLQEDVTAWNRWRVRYPAVVPDLSSVQAQGGNFLGAHLQNANLENANFYFAHLTASDLSHANLAGANLGHAKLANADLSSARLEGTDLSSADLTSANLSKGNLTRADLSGAVLDGANLIGANLFAANLFAAALRGANLCEANLSLANLSLVKLDHADISSAVLCSTILAGTDLSLVKGIETVKHEGPSPVGVDTIYRFKDRIPEDFLRGCGVPDDFIAYAKSLVASPIQFYSCFISYSTKDQDFADRLYADLQNKGVRCWFAPLDVQSGKKLHEQIDEAIRLHDKLLLILSPHSMKSEWVKTEIATARKREVHDKRRVLFPIRLVLFKTLRHWECFDADTGKDSAREIREYFIPDFSNWKDHDSYQEAFQRLISDLKASDARPPATQPTHPK
jgi:uncharacterized protein YjbI with pentapeptide repeats